MIHLNFFLLTGLFTFIILLNFGLKLDFNFLKFWTKVNNLSNVSLKFAPSCLRVTRNVTYKKRTLITLSDITFSGKGSVCSKVKKTDLDS